MPVTYGPCYTKLNKSGKRFVTCVGAQQQLRIKQKKMKKLKEQAQQRLRFAEKLRNDSTIEFSYPLYKRWRNFESECNQLAMPLVCNLSLEKTPLQTDIHEKIRRWLQLYGIDKVSMLVLFHDTPEACVGLYEKQTLEYLDNECYNSIHKHARIRTHPEWDPNRYRWTSLYFRRHLVCAWTSPRSKTIIVFNAAQRNFCDIETDSQQKNEVRRKFYEKVFSDLARTAFQQPDKAVVVRHLGYQGTNDCSVWINLLPIVFEKISNKQTATITNPAETEKQFLLRNT